MVLTRCPAALLSYRWAITDLNDVLLKHSEFGTHTEVTDKKIKSPQGSKASLDQSRAAIYSNADCGSNSDAISFLTVEIALWIFHRQQTKPCSFSRTKFSWCRNMKVWIICLHFVNIFQERCLTPPQSAVVRRRLPCFWGSLDSDWYWLECPARRCAVTQTLHPYR